MKTIPSLSVVKSLTGILAMSAFALTDARAVILFQNSADFTNFTTSGTSATATVGVVTTPTSTITGDAVRFVDTDSTKLPAMFYQVNTPLNTGIKISFDVKIASNSSNLVFRVGPTASSVGTLANSSVGIQLTNTGTVVAEQGTTVGGANNNTPTTYGNSYSTANVFNVTIFYNKSGSSMDFSASSGPSFLAADQWALYIDGTAKNITLAERYVKDYSSSFGFGWLSGTSATAAAMDFQLDNIQYDLITAVPEPSTYAALCGMAALGFVAVRRRRSVVMAG